MFLVPLLPRYILIFVLRPKCRSIYHLLTHYSYPKHLLPPEFIILIIYKTNTANYKVFLNADKFCAVISHTYIPLIDLLPQLSHFSTHISSPSPSLTRWAPFLHP